MDFPILTADSALNTSTSETKLDFWWYLMRRGDWILKWIEVLCQTLKKSLILFARVN